MVKAARVRDLRDVNLEDYHQEARENAMPMKNPPHPGDFIRTEIVEPAGLSVTAAAAALGVSRPALSSLLNGKAGLSAVQQLSRTVQHFMQDAPACDTCGAITVRNGACYKCLNCGNSMGCS